MKCKLLILLMVCFVGVGCKSYHGEALVITSKAYVQSGIDMPPCICKFNYNYYSSFQDSCNFYRIGDTINNPIHNNK